MTVRDQQVVMGVAGGLAAHQTASISSSVNGCIIALHVEEGAAVTRDTVLAEIQPHDYQAAVAQAEAAEAQALQALHQAESDIVLSANGDFDPKQQRSVVMAAANLKIAESNLANVSADLNRYEELLKTGDVSQNSVDQARNRLISGQNQLSVNRTQYESALASAGSIRDRLGAARAGYTSAQSASATARYNLENCKVRSPIAGVVLSLPAALGSFVAAGTPIATVGQIEPIVMDAIVPEGKESSLAPGQSTDVHVASYPDRTFPGVLRSVSPSLNVSNRSVTARIEIANPGGRLRPGMFATAEIGLPQTERAQFVPSGAVHGSPGADSSTLYVASGDRAEARIVRVGDAIDGHVRVYSGINDGDQIVVSADGTLIDGAPLKTRP